MSNSIIYYISIATSGAFILPVLRQYKGYYFFYFLILASSSFSSFVLVNIGINPNINLLISTHLLLLSQHYKYLAFRSNLLVFSFYILISMVLYSFFSYQIVFIYVTFIHYIIIGFITNRALKSVYRYLEIRYFYIVLLLYEISIILKLLAIVTNIIEGPYHFAITNVFQIFIALYFTIYREDRPHSAIYLTHDTRLIEDRRRSTFFDNWDV